MHSWLGVPAARSPPSGLARADCLSPRSPPSASGIPLCMPSASGIPLSFISPAKPSDSPYYINFNCVPGWVLRPRARRPPNAHAILLEALRAPLLRRLNQLRNQPHVPGLISFFNLIAFLAGCSGRALAALRMRTRLCLKFCAHHCSGCSLRRAGSFLLISLITFLAGLLRPRARRPPDAHAIVLEVLCAPLP